MSAPVALPVLPPKLASSNSLSFSFIGNPQSMMQSDQYMKSFQYDHKWQTIKGGQYLVENSSVDIAQETCIFAPAPFVSRSFSQPAHTAPSPATVSSSSNNVGLGTLRIPTTPIPIVHMPPGMSGTPMTPGPPGISSSAPFSLNLTVTSGAIDSSSAALVRPTMPAAPGPLNPAVQLQAYPPYPSVPPIAAPSHGLWLPPPQLSGLPRPPFLPYPATFPGPFPLPTRGLSLPSVPLPDAQPPGVTPLGMPIGTSMITVTSGSPLTTGSWMQQETPPGIDNSKLVTDVGTKDGAAISKQLDAWTAHKSETGVVYYYNALTGESTYEKPYGFKGEHFQIFGNNSSFYVYLGGVVPTL
ncbi:hypothetical protein Acr_25g0001130 [Actinidia rufa]|uniref:WW domain-containing protein n=1 Tax=Actinidia rufa TaxID=165716 RepID=A0A7J0GYW0_9ERIC|nr:hypothetical protein Acr_25g0001130 [Actinidia rufa]